MRQLSKSKIIAFRQCPKRLWLELNKPELRDDSASKVVFAIGNQVGEAARMIFDPAGEALLIDIDALGWDEGFRLTAEWLSDGRAPIFEAALRIEGGLALADAMFPVSRNGGATRWRMVEVKSSASVKDYHHDDLAVQAYIAERAGVDLAGAAIAHVDTSFVYPGGGDYSGLLVEADLTEEVRSRTAEVEEWFAEAQEVAAMEREPDLETGPHCSVPFDCPFRHYCDRHREKAEYPLDSLYRLRGAEREALEAEGCTDLREVPDDRLSPKNQLIKRQSIAGTAWFDAEGTAATLAPHTGTAFFLDFETIASAVPIWPGTRPYQQNPFQFSLHIREPDGPLHHREFLDLSGSDPSGEFARALVEQCGGVGPVFVYNAGFERSVIRLLAGRHPGLAPQLEAISERIVDLLPVARDHYYHPAQHGSWSIKAVLPCVCPDLRYEDLEGVADGQMAQTAFLEAIDPETGSERREEIRSQLLEYCRLDTFGMVRLWEVFSGKGEGES